MEVNYYHRGLSIDTTSQERFDNKVWEKYFAKRQKPVEIHKCPNHGNKFFLDTSREEGKYNVSGINRIKYHTLPGTPYGIWERSGSVVEYLTRD